jgi:SH3-like domain-containing protein
MKNLFRLCVLLAAVNLGILAPAIADPIRQGAEHCVVNVRHDDPLNLRSAPNATARILSTLPFATCGIVVTGNCRGNWCPVEDGHSAGWAHRHYIAPILGQMHCVASIDDVALRAWPSSRSPTLTRLPAGLCELRILPFSTEGWRKVRAGGREGWLPRAAIGDGS